MLDSRGIAYHEDDTILNTCKDCYTSLLANKIPRFALVNNLFRGLLPSEFSDLTWVEERVCAKYISTAMVTRLFQSSDPAQPKVFHGNTCAHEMNVVSTAKVLPRTPSDVNGSLSVVFVGPGKFKPENAGTMYRIRKQKVWNFLQWLKLNNILYADIEIDHAILDLYPNDGFIPGLEDRVIHDSISNPNEIFTEENAGLSEHPAELLYINDDGHSDNTVMLEKMGVCDPECEGSSGRTFTAAALRNLVALPNNSDLPDLILFRGSKAISEYQNPYLMPGMFPTLFPLGIGGFEDSKRPTPLSFGEQANYYLDLVDREFRYHHSYIFIAVNIKQRRAAHLQTHFTIQKNKFHAIAQKLIDVKPDTLLSVANHLEKEGKYSDLNNEQKMALELLKHVNTIASRIPGSQAAKVFARSEIRSYCGHFGLPHLYLTLNPSPAHSPIFQVMFGDKTVDLTQRFPTLVPSRERALRLAKDPVAAADFFHFSITAIFSCLFGWDYAKSCSKPSGGILGKLRAFYGTSETTDRGSLHGHFLLWLVGGLNPDELHKKLKDVDGFDQQFFSFFESIIYHHLPDIEVEFDPKSYEPRTQRPPIPPDDISLLENIEEWESVFCTEVKMCGEVLQRHGCRKVCHKYGNEGKCRFLFPHEVVKASHFDADTNSVVLLCLDPTVNYFNPYLLVFCRHNHDLKCILSGKGAKAAMFYITDYITKMDLKTYQMLSLLSRAVASLNSSSEKSLHSNAVDSAKALLHRCLSQFARQQQVHAQQAAHYLCGHDDTIPSHKTIPMMSSLLLSHVKETVPCNSDLDTHEDDNGSSSDEDDNPGTSKSSPSSDEDQSLGNSGSRKDEAEAVSLRIAVTKNGNLYTSNQVIDYIYRDDSLSLLSFYDFCRCVRLEKKTLAPKNTHESRLGVLARHSLKPSHPLSLSHHLVEHTNESRGDGTYELVLRVVGMVIPRPSDPKYKLFALAHFKPFSLSNPLIPEGDTVERCFENYNFHMSHMSIMKNWDALYECQDQRDLERLRKRDALTKESLALTRSLQSDFIDIDANILGDNGALSKHQLARELEAMKYVNLMHECQWLTISHPLTPLNNLNNEKTHPEPTPVQLAKWKVAIKSQESSAISKRRNAENLEHQSDIVKTTLTSLEQMSCINSMPPNPTISIDKTTQTITSIVDQVSADFKLNRKQNIVYRIIINRFLDQTIYKIDSEDNKDALRMFLTGPGGTGKTHSVKAVQKLMKTFGYSHLIRFLGPTGSSARQVGGMTIHKGLGLKISSNTKGKSCRKPGEDNDGYSVYISVRNRTMLRDEWKYVEYLFIDEVSLISAQLLCEIDHALRYAKEKFDVWFGGIHVIFAGDFYQYPPVGGSPLYSPIFPNASSTATELTKRLGRLAWKSVNSVTSLTEQQRMKDDPDFGNAINRLRTRTCTLDDLDLFNSRVIKSSGNPNGFVFHNTNYLQATILVSNNYMRELLNSNKAKVACGQSENLIVCAALDTVDGTPPNRSIREELLNRNMSKYTSEGALPGYIPLYIGMPVILRSHNISTELGITNGSQGIVRKIFTKICSNGFTVAKCVFVEFPDSDVSLPDLPPHWYPVTPSTWKFSTQVMNNDISTQAKVSREQLPIQPAFAVTGHSAQGKTLKDGVIINLHEGGSASYVAASRPCTRDGLFITQAVTLDQINKPASYDLRQEMKRLDTIEWNTMVQYGYSTGLLKDVIDPESEQSAHYPQVKPNFVDGYTLHKPNDAIRTTLYNSSTLNVGCVWSERDWSCAYDSVFMMLFSTYHYSSAVLRIKWISESERIHQLSEIFDDLLLPDNIHRSSEFTRCRDLLRDILSSHSPSLFPRYGQETASVVDILSYFSEGASLFFEKSCTNECTFVSQEIWLPAVLSPSIWGSEGLESRAFHKAPIQKWIDTFIERKKRRTFHTPTTCSQCHSNCSTQVYLKDISTSLYFEISPQVLNEELFSPNLYLPGSHGTVAYDLKGIVYSGGSHFSTRWRTSEGIWWEYDGRVHGGCPSRVTGPTLSEFAGRKAHTVFYFLQEETAI